VVDAKKWQIAKRSKEMRISFEGWLELQLDALFSEWKWKARLACCNNGKARLLAVVATKLE